MRDNFSVIVVQDEEFWYTELDIGTTTVEMKFDTKDAAYAIKTLLEVTRRVSIKSYTESKDE